MAPGGGDGGETVGGAEGVSSRSSTTALISIGRLPLALI